MFEVVVKSPFLTQSGHYQVCCKEALECPISSAQICSRRHRVVLGQIDAQALEAGGRRLRPGLVDADVLGEDCHGRIGP